MFLSLVKVKSFRHLRSKTSEDIPKSSDNVDPSIVYEAAEQKIPIDGAKPLNRGASKGYRNK